MPINRRAFIEMSGGALFMGSVQAPSPTVKIEKDVVFGKGGQTELHCDIYHPPAGNAKRMALIHLHGGGFAGGSKDNLADRVLPITSRGYLSIVSQYRLSGIAKWPAQIHDVKAAIRWTHANAGSLGVDPQRIAVVGYSAGGHMALFAAGTCNDPHFEGESGTPNASTQVAACVAFYPVTEITPQNWGRVLMLAGSDDAAHRAASPITYISKTFAPTLLFHGLDDITVPPESSEHFLQKLREVGVPSELHTFAGVPHAFDEHPEFAQACAELIDFFLDRLVLNPRTYPPFQPGGPR